MTEPQDLALPNGWHLITYGAEQISVAPDGLIMFPRHITPAQIPDYLAALSAAAEIGEQIQTDNAEKAAQNTSKGLSTRRAILTQGPPPPGATPLPQTTIGKPKGRQR
jgi:hypothetical protein